MTTSVMILVKDHCSLATLAEFVAATLDVPLNAVHQENIGSSFSGDVFEGCYIDVFDDHGFEDNVGIPFAAYEFAVDFSVLGKWEYGSGKQEVVAIALSLSKAIANFFRTQCIVVDNLQSVLATVEPEEPTGPSI